MKKFSLGALAATAVAAIPTALALGSFSDGGGLTTLPLHTTAKSSSVTLTVTNDTFGEISGTTTTCTASHEALTLNSGGALSQAGVAMPVSAPVFTGCTDNLQTTHSVTINVSGHWTSTYHDDSSESGAEVLGPGDSISIQSPKNGIAFIDAGTPECKIQANPAGTDPAATGVYNDSTGVDSINYTGGTFTVITTPGQTTACPFKGDTGTYSFTGTYNITPILADG